jgi:hypothetical protein
VPADPLAEQAWWERVHRAAKGKGSAGSKLMSDWARARLPVIAAEPGELDLVGPFGHRRWEPTPPEVCTEEYKQRETRRLNDELGIALGIGPMP